MIKINLLPTKKKPPKKVTELQQQLILGTLILTLTGIGMWFYWSSLNTKINILNRDKAAAEGTNPAAEQFAVRGQQRRGRAKESRG